MIDFDELATRATTPLQKQLVQVGRELGDVLQYGPKYRRGAREHFAEAWRRAQQTDQPGAFKGAKREMILAIVHGGQAACGHDVGRWYQMPHTPEQKALPNPLRHEAVAFCDCGAFYDLDGIDSAANPRPHDTDPPESVERPGPVLPLLDKLMREVFGN